MIQLRVDAHDRHASLDFAVFDRALDRRSTAILRKNRCMDIEERDPQQVGRQNLSVRDDDADVRLQRVNLIEHLPDLRRLCERQSEIFGVTSNRGRLELEPAPGPFVGLGDHQHDLVRAREDIQRWDGEIGSA